MFYSEMSFFIFRKNSIISFSIILLKYDLHLKLLQVVLFQIDQDDRNVGAEENLDDESRAQDKILKEKYELACRQLREKVSEIEAIQIRILRLLLTDVDNTGQVRTREYGCYF